MSITFPRLFESLAYCRKESRIILDTDPEKYPIRVEDSLFLGGRSMRYFSPQKIARDDRFYQNAQSTRLFIKCIKNFIQEKKGCTKEITFLINRLKTDIKDGAPLTAQKIRKAYKICIASFLDGYRKIAVQSKKFDRLVFLKDHFAIQNEKVDIEENRNAMRAFKASLIEEWGIKRVKRAENRYKIKLDEMIQNGEELTPQLINRLMPGIVDYYSNDLLKCYQVLNQIIAGDQKLSALSQRTIRKLAEMLNLDPLDEEGIVTELTKSYKDDINVPFLDLNLRALSLIQGITLLDAGELELAFQGTRLEGVVDGLQTPINCFFSTTNEIEDLLRLHMYHIILTAKNSIEEKQLEPFFDEILVKGIVKKEMTADMLVPSPWKKDNTSLFYMVRTKIRTVDAKFGYYLTPIGKTLEKMIVVFRSTSSTPSTTDSLKSVITGFYPRGFVGYYSRFVGKEHEIDVLHDSKNPLKLLGHSLGGVFAQLLLVNRIQEEVVENELNTSELPVRDYEIGTFDSPKIKSECAEDFAKWSESESAKKLLGRISIIHYTSTGDPVPFLAEALLGSYADPTKFKSIKVVQLTPIIKENPVLATHPHGRHYFRTQMGKDFKAEEIPINDTISKKWHLVEVIRRIMGFILFPLLWLFDILKTLFFGIERNIHEETSKVWRKLNKQMNQTTV